MPNVGEKAGGSPRAQKKWLPSPLMGDWPIKGTTQGTILANERAMCGQATVGMPQWL